MKHKWDLQGYFPLGKDWRSQLNGILYGYVLSILFSVVCYGMRLSNAYWQLFPAEAAKSRLPEKDAVMQDFGDVLSISFMGFAILCVYLVFRIIFNYRYHHQGSQSIYLMKRLPKKFEMQKRCVLVPAVGILVSIATAFLLLYIYYLIYFLVTPEQCLTPGQWQKLWS